MNTYYGNNYFKKIIHKCELDVMFSDTWLLAIYNKIKMYYSLNLYEISWTISWLNCILPNILSSIYDKLHLTQYS